MTDPPHQTTQVDGRTRHWRIAYGLTGLVLTALALFEVLKHGTGVWQLMVFALAPDLAFLVDARRMKQRGQMGPWAVRVYNATHHFTGPAVLGLLLVWVSTAWLVAALAWGAHIAVDRSLGFGLRDKNGSVRPIRPERHPVRWTIAGVVTVALAGGAVFEALASRSDPGRYPPPGRMVMVGGHRFHMDCIGSGGPTVVMEAGLGESSLTWSLVQPRLASTRVCSYDRAGYGWNDAGPLPRSPGREAVELHELLQAAGERPPYVLVAHSLGANVTRLFVSRYRNDVAGVVLVEPSDEVAMIRAGTPYLPIFQFGLFSFLGRIGVVRLFGSSLIPAFAEPTPAAMDRLPLLYGPRAMDTAAAELRASVDGARSVAAVTSAGAWGSLPLIVVIARQGGDPAEGKRLAALSTIGEAIVANGSGHYVQVDRPDVVIASIRRVLVLARER
jgi:pimeloyl-ACP methyl ester carboxylesterase